VFRSSQVAYHFTTFYAHLFVDKVFISDNVLSVPGDDSSFL
jgi:hypothetical protein